MCKVKPEVCACALKRFCTSGQSLQCHFQPTVCAALCCNVDVGACGQVLFAGHRVCQCSWEVVDTLQGLLHADIWLWLKNPVPKWVALVSGNMDQNLRNPFWLILSHTHIAILSSDHFSAWSPLLVAFPLGCFLFLPFSRWSFSLALLSSGSLRSLRMLLE